MKTLDFTAYVLVEAFVLVLGKTIPTTKLCMSCGQIHDMRVWKRTFTCGCGCSGDRDVHAAQNMVAIAEMILGKQLTVPVGRREFKREEFLKAYEEKFSKGYEGRGSAKITPFKA